MDQDIANVRVASHRKASQLSGCTLWPTQDISQDFCNFTSMMSAACRQPLPLRRAMVFACPRLQLVQTVSEWLRVFGAVSDVAPHEAVSSAPVLSASLPSVVTVIALSLGNVQHEWRYVQDEFDFGIIWGSACCLCFQYVCPSSYLK